MIRRVLIAVAAMMIVVTGPSDDVAAADKIMDLDASVSRGGRIYNDWMIELDERAPKEGNPAFPKNAKSKKDIADSWRCVSCHGWDYKGANSQKGIMGKVGASPADIVSVLKDKTHGYQEYLDNDDMIDLARFISTGMTDMDDMIERGTGKAKAYGLKQRPFFETVCAMCHGAEGQSLPGVSLGAFAIQQPYLTLHSIFNGHPGAVMPSLRAFENQKLVELLAYMQTLPENASLVSIVRGGRLYDNWFMETGFEAPTEIHSAYPRKSDLKIKPKQTWLCKECHGWDYLGKDGQYGKGKHFTGIKGIADQKGADVKEIIQILKDDTHGYGRVLSMLDLLDLANFVREGQLDMEDYIDPATKVAKGDYQAHAKFYPTLCGNCHGPKGRAIRTMGALGRVANDDPWKSLHKILNGHPAEEMPAWRSLDQETVQDLMGYIQALPKNKRS
ncbi:c-type cytochrome [Terasakiella sp. A23]|uniref:c-type cytochrome n=1 Tax=Terasakiella sp. FCG-A23 TaxID=3080561 RepID=UPI002954F059|nr:c-type cytochrome [Terasakiella sp. A23]MDV7340901.1 c-type cytochrome [Terasakiella sp. A23]